MIRKTPPTTPPTSFQWFAVRTGILAWVCAAGMRAVPGDGVLITWLEFAEGIALKDWLAEGDGAAFIAWLAEGLLLPSRYAGIDPVALARGTCGALAASSNAAKNCWPLEYLSDGFLDSAFNTTREIVSDTRGCAIPSGCGSTSVMPRSTSPRCFPWNALRPVYSS